jgi:hypothetical protein
MKPRALKIRRLEWERPKIIVASCLPEALGDCVGGSTQVTGTGGGCFNGNNTGGSTAGGHVCQNGNTQP